MENKKYSVSSKLESNLFLFMQIRVVITLLRLRDLRGVEMVWKVQDSKWWDTYIRPNKPIDKRREQFIAQDVPDELRRWMMFDLLNFW